MPNKVHAVVKTNARTFKARIKVRTFKAKTKAISPEAKAIKFGLEEAPRGQGLASRTTIYHCLYASQKEKMIPYSI